MYDTPKEDARVGNGRMMSRTGSSYTRLYFIIYFNPLIFFDWLVNIDHLLIGMIFCRAYGSIR